MTLLNLNHCIQINYQYHKPFRQIILLPHFSLMIIYFLLPIQLFFPTLFLILMILSRLNLSLILVQHLSRHSYDLQVRCLHILHLHLSRKDLRHLHLFLQLIIVYELRQDLLGGHVWVLQVYR